MYPERTNAASRNPKKRSYLFVSGNRPDLVEKACRSGADALILDLEDSVAESDKDSAREAVRSTLSEHLVYVRINGPTTSHFGRDLAALATSQVAGVMLPKAETPEHISEIRGYFRREVEILPLVETAYGLLEARILVQMPGVAQLVFGSVDFALDAGIEGDGEGLLYARSTLVVASRAAGKLEPVDGVTTTIKDSERLAADVARAKRLGFGAKLCIHPSQVEEVNRGFAPTEIEVAWANRILEATQGGTLGVTEVKGQMVDRPVIERAKAIFARAHGR